MPANCESDVNSLLVSFGLRTADTETIVRKMDLGWPGWLGMNYVCCVNISASVPIFVFDFFWKWVKGVGYSARSEGAIKILTMFDNV